MPRSLRARPRRRDRASLVLTHNRVELLQKCVENVLLRTSEATREIVIWDNGSTDGTRRVPRHDRRPAHPRHPQRDERRPQRLRARLPRDDRAVPGRDRRRRGRRAAALGRDDARRLQRLPDVGFLAADLVDDPNDEASRYRHEIRAHEYTPVEENGVRLLTGPAGGGCAITSRELNAARRRLQGAARTRCSGSRTAPTSPTSSGSVPRGGSRRPARAPHRRPVLHDAAQGEDRVLARYWRARRAPRRGQARRSCASPFVRRLNARFGWFVAPVLATSSSTSAIRATQRARAYAGGRLGVGLPAAGAAAAAPRAGARPRPWLPTSAGRTTRRLRQRREHVAHVAVRHGGEDRPPGGEVLVGLVRDQPGARARPAGRASAGTAGRRERISATRLAMVEQPGLRTKAWPVGHGAVGVGQLAREVQLDRPRERRVGGDQPLERPRRGTRASA